jgi:hypothetical protein
MRVRVSLDFDILIESFISLSGADTVGGGPPKIGKNMIFWRKIVIKVC